MEILISSETPTCLLWNFDHQSFELKLAFRVSGPLQAAKYEQIIKFLFRPLFMWKKSLFSIRLTTESLKYKVNAFKK